MNNINGVYVLIIQLDADTSIRVGALGKKTLKKGLYAYVGSAQTNLEQRIKRHFKKEKRLFWHIDYLLSKKTAKIVKVLYKQADRIEECEIARNVSQKGKSINDFGSSDCNCKSHLFCIENHYFLQKSMQTLHTKQISEKKILPFI